MKKKIISKVISGTILCSMLAYTTPVFAYTKDETVYTKLDSNGNQNKTIVTTHLKNDIKSKELKDMTDLINIKNTSGEETYTKDEDYLTWNTEGEDIYYQGETSKNLPITCKIKYELDGKEISSNEILGKSGKVKIILEYINNEEREVSINGTNEKVYVPFVVVAGTIIDNSKNRNIEVSNGKIIDDGSKTIAMGIALPGMKESLKLSNEDINIPNSIEITMDAKDFEQSNIMTYITPKVFEEDDLDIFDKLDEVYTKVDTLQSSSKAIVDGANTLKEGTQTYSKKSEEFNNAMKQVKSGVSTLNSKYTELDEGINSLKSGSTELLAGVQTLNQSAGALSNLGTLTSSVPQLYSASTSVNNGVTALEQQINANNQTLQATINALDPVADATLISSLQTQLDNNKVLMSNLEPSDRTKGLTYASGALNNGLQTMNNSVGQMTGLDTLTTGATKLVNGTTALSEGINKLSAGSSELKKGIQTLDASTKAVVSADNQLTQGAKTLAEGATKLAEGTIKFDQEGIQKICNYINGDTKDVTQRIEKLADLANNYNNFTKLESGNEGTVKFIMIIEAIKEQDNKENAILETKK